MGKLKSSIVILVIFFLFITLSHNYFLEISENNIQIGKKINVTGEVFYVDGNNMPSNSKKRFESFKFNENFDAVVAINGKVENLNSSPELSINQIKSKFYMIDLGRNGKFSYKLKPGTYSFFLKVNAKIYLNSFDELGLFKSVNITNENNKVILSYDKNLLN